MKICRIGYFETMMLMFFFFSCSDNKEVNIKDITQVEKDFETAVRTKGLAEAFYEFADENAVIKRKNDTIIRGKENIRKFYQSAKTGDVSLTWTPDFVDISDDATLAYTYGKFIWKSKAVDGRSIESKGVFHTIWKKQKDGSWRYVWD